MSRSFHLDAQPCRTSASLVLRVSDAHYRPISARFSAPFAFGSLRCDKRVIGAPPMITFTRSKLTYWRVKARPADRRPLPENGQLRAFTPAVIIFIALPEAKDNIDPG